MQGLVLAGCAVLLAACSRGPDTRGDSAQVAAAKGAIAHRLGTMATAEFRQIVEYRDGVVCGEFDSHKMFSGANVGFRQFIYNAPEPGALVIDSNLSPQEIGYWCSQQPDKRLRMVAASVAELAQACKAGGGKSSDTACRLAEEQQRTLNELQAQAGHSAASSAGRAPQAATASATQTPASAVMAANSASAPVVAAAPQVPQVPPASQASQASQVPPRAEAAAPAAALPASAANGDAAIRTEVEAALQAWRQSWQDGNVDAYLRLYEDSFAGDAGSHAKWAQQRRQKMQNVHPSVDIHDLKLVRIKPQEVEVRFVQVYAARQHRDTGDKTIVLRRSPRGWLIAEERWKARS